MNQRGPMTIDQPCRRAAAPGLEEDEQREGVLNVRQLPAGALLQRLHEQRPWYCRLAIMTIRHYRRAELKPAVVDIHRASSSGPASGERQSVADALSSGSSATTYTIGLLGWQTTQSHSKRNLAGANSSSRFRRKSGLTRSRALYSTDASVYQIHPLGVVVAEIARRHRSHRQPRAGARRARSRRGAAARRRPGRRSATACSSTRRATRNRHPRAERRRSAGRSSSRASCSTS